MHLSRSVFFSMLEPPLNAFEVYPPTPFHHSPFLPLTIKYFTPSQFILLVLQPVFPLNPYSNLPRLAVKCCNLLASKGSVWASVRRKGDGKTWPEHNISKAKVAIKNGYMQSPNGM